MGVVAGAVGGLPAEREERRRQRLAILAAALRRMDEDEYGYCLSCGDDIAAARLAADPAATLCVDCQRGR